MNEFLAKSLHFDSQKSFDYEALVIILVENVFCINADFASITISAIVRPLPAASSVIVMEGHPFQELPPHTILIMMSGLSKHRNILNNRNVKLSNLSCTVKCVLLFTTLFSVTRPR